MLAAYAAGHTILTPNAELAAALFDALERVQTQAARHVWATPRVRDFGGWLRELHGQSQLANAESLRVLSDVEERELWRSIVDRSAIARDFLDPGGAALAARRARRALREFDIPFAALEQESADEVQSFLAWNHAFEQRCRELGCISADHLLSLVAPVGPISWIESPAWRPAARRWLSRRGQMLPPQTIAGLSPAVTRAPSPAAEFAMIGEWARKNLGEHEHFRAWICIPDLNRRRTQIIDAMDAALAPQRFSLSQEIAAAPYAVAGGTPLSDHAPVRVALDTLAASLGSVRHLEFSALLRSPELQETDAEASAAALLDVALRDRANAEADLSTWLDVAERVAHQEGLGPVAALQRLSAVRAALAGVRGTQRFSAWVSVWIGALEAGPWVWRKRWSSGEYQAAQRFRELLATLAMGDAVFGAQSRDSAQRILRRAAKDTAFQPQTGVPAIWVSGQLVDPWLNYQGLWVSGCSDEQWPPPILPVPLLPIRLQREHGIISASAESQVTAAKDLQTRWMSRAGQCVFSYADLSDGSLSAPSPVLPEGSNSDSELPAAAASQPHWRAAELTPHLEAVIDEKAPPFSPPERFRGVASLKAQSRCAFRGFAETRLAAQPLGAPEPGFNARERGQLTHYALEHVWSRLRDSISLRALSADEQRTLLDQAAIHAISVVCKTRDPGPRWRRRERVRLQNLLGGWLDVERLRAPFAVEVLERGVHDARFAGLEFRVRIDRVDRLEEDGARVLIDYKTGSATADWRGERPDNPQLPIYALLLPEALVSVAYAQVKVGDSKFVAEAARDDIYRPRSKATALEEQASFSDLVGLWSRRIERIAGEFSAGRAEVAPTLKACKTCDLQTLCRVPALLQSETDA